MEIMFGEFLIEEKLLNQEQLLEAIIEQLQSIPSVPEVMFESNIIPKSDLLRILLHQKYEGSEFLVSAKTLGFWSPSISQQVLKKLENIQKPLGEVLIQKGFIDLESLSKTFVKYLETKENIKKLDAQEKSDLDSAILKEYIMFFEGVFFPKIETLLGQLKQVDKTKESFLNDMQLVLSEFVAVRAGAEFLGGLLSKDISNKIILFIEKTIEPSSTEEFASIIEILEMSVKILSNYCKSLKNFNSEGSVDDSTKELITKFWEKIGAKGIK